MSDVRDWQAFAAAHFEGAELRRAWRLEGGVTAEVTALEIETVAGTIETLVVKRYDPETLGENPEVTRQEFRTLAALSSADVPVPRPLALDEAGRWLAMAYVEGSVDAYPGDMNTHMAAFASMLAHIHALPLDNPGLDFLTDQQELDSQMLTHPPAVLHPRWSEAEIREALAPVWPPARRHADVFLHGDFWPGNILWRDGRIMAVLDWEEAIKGDPLIDVAVARLELTWAYGLDTANRFAEFYAARTGVDLTDLAIWDLMAALRPIHRISGWGLSASHLRRTREGHRSFTAHAIERLRATR